MKYSTHILSGIVALSALVGTQAWAQSGRISSVAISSGVVTITERTAANTNPPVTNANQPVYVGDNLAGLTFFNGNPAIDGLPASPTSAVLFTLTGSLIPGGAGTDLHAFMGYGTLIGPPTLAATYNDVAPLLVANTTYEGLVFVEPDLYPGGPAPLTSNVLYTIHHAVNGTDYLAAIVPATGGGSAVLDIKPMSWAGGVAGGPASIGSPGYFALTFAAPTPTGPYFANLFYYLRTDGLGQTQFGYVIPALVSGSLDTLNLNTAVGSFGASDYTTLAYSPVAFGGYASSQFYYLRQDTGPGGTGNTILGRLDTNPANRTISDIANLGGVFDTLTYVFDATGTAPAWGSNQLFVAGAPLAAGAQSISFAAISDKNVGDQFTVTPTASSGLDLVVTVVSGPATVVASGLTGFNPSQRIFTVTTTGPGVVKLQATQAGSAAPLVVANMMQQSFNVLGLPSITSGGTAAATVGVPFTFNITATGDPIIAYTAIGLPASLTLNSTTGAITGTPIAAGIINVTDITARNATGTSSATTLTITVGAAGAAPIITSDTSTAGTIDKSFNFSIVASGSPTSYTASPLPAGVLFNTITGVFSGKPTTEGVTSVALSATNAGGTDTATLTITVGAAGIPPIITSGITAPGTVGTTFGPYQIVATGLPTSYSAAGLPAGLIVNVLTGRISGTPTTAGVSVATINATNLGGTGSATLTITVAAVGVAPIITSATTTSGDVGTVFLTYQIVATGLPTSFSATGLPAGLTVNALTGAINGTPTTEGVSIATIKATNSAGTGTASLRITVAAASSSPIITSANTAAGTVGTPFVTYQILATGNPTSYGAGNLPAGLVVNTLTGRITGTPVSTGNYRVFVRATTSVGVASETVAFAIAPAISVQPASTSVASGAGTTFSVEADSGGNPKTYQWQKHGVDLPGATGTTLTIANVKSEDVGTYRVVVSSWGTSTTSVPALLGMTFTGQIAGSATMVGADIVHPNGNIYDQVLLTGSAASVKADPGQIVRISFVDLTDDIVQLELGGAGTLTINLANSSGPAAPVNYEQPGVLYMKGHASISIRDADATTNVSVFSVGRSNAVDQGLFREGVAYDGYADISLLNIGSTDGFFGGARTANASYFGSSGMTGIFAAGVQFSGPVYVQDINGANNANAVLMLGLAGDVRITGGNLLQDNGGSIEVSGITRLQFTDGTSSGGALLPAQVNRGVLMTNGVDVTGRLVP